MEYIVYRNFREPCFSGVVYLPRGSRCESVGDTIFSDRGGKPLVYTTSKNAHDFFARNDDGKGLDRGALIYEITCMLRRPVNPANMPLYRLRWDAVWNDPELRKFKRVENADYWLWNHAFYNADIKDLEYIKEKIKSVRRK